MLFSLFSTTLLALSPDMRSHSTSRTAPTSSEPNIVTPLLPAGYAQAQANSRVHLPNYNRTDLYSGFFTIDKETGSNTYFIYTTPISGRKDAPVLLWLNGGPGASSLLGFFDELGPFGIDDKMQIVERDVSWARDAHLIAMDNPLGVGYSFTHSQGRMATNQTTVGADLHEAIRQFFELFPALRANDFFVTGESYAGKYVPAAAYTIHMRNQRAPPEQRINLKGIAIGDGAFDPPTQFTGFGPLLFNIGLADLAAKARFEAYDVQFTARLSAGDRVGAFRSFDEMINGDYFGTDKTFYHNVTGMGSNYFNFAEEPGAASLTKRTFPSWLALAPVADALHVGAVPYSVFNQTVEDHLLADWVVGVVPMLETLLESYAVLIYSGQYDVILGPPGTERAVAKLRWSGAKPFASKPARQIFDGAGNADLAGYVRQAPSAANTTFSYVMLRGCGHMVPTDQPVRAYTMLQQFLVPMAPLPPMVVAPPK
jgi:vitellogenic carboxypeptidase-like protein